MCLIKRIVEEEIAVIFYLVRFSCFLVRCCAVTEGVELNGGSNTSSVLPLKDVVANKKLLSKFSSQTVCSRFAPTKAENGMFFFKI